MLVARLIYNRKRRNSKSNQPFEMPDSSPKSKEKICSDYKPPLKEIPELKEEDEIKRYLSHLRRKYSEVDQTDDYGDARGFSLKKEKRNQGHQKSYIVTVRNSILN